MPAAASALVVVPTLGFLSLLYAARPATDTTVGPYRLAAVRAALATGAYAVLTVELLGALDALALPGITLAWLIFLIVAVALAELRRRRDPRPVTPLDRFRAFRRTASRGEHLLAGTVLGLLLVELVVAVLAEPNNYDSQTYHLPKVEHWVAQRTVEIWPTVVDRQVTMPPGAEYLLLHLRLFTGGDGLYNLVQWAAGLACLLLAARIAAQLGGGRRAQLLTAFLVGTTPMVVLQATSTQTDLVTAAWVACLATLVLDGLTRRVTAGSALALGVATGLVAVTKTSGLIGAGPLLVLWALAQLRLGRTGGQVGRAVWRTGLASVVILLLAAAITGPYLARMTEEFGHPLGPPRLRDVVPTQRHDPGSILVNTLRIAHTALDTPLSALTDTPAGVVADAPAEAIKGGARLIGVDPQDRAITFGRTTFPVQSWYPDEDRVAFPIAGALALLGGLFALVRPRRISSARPGTLRAYAVTAAVTLVLHCSMVKWQPWGNRLLLYLLVMALPLAGLWLDALLRRRTGGGTATDRPARRSVAVVLAVALLAGSALAGVLAVSYGFPRRLVGSGSVFTTSDWDTRFLRRPQWADEFTWAADRVRASGAHRIGLVQQVDNWEYPWWLLLRDDTGGTGREIVALQSLVPKRPPADPSSVDAIICTGRPADCTKLVPAGWPIEWNGHVAVALPPTPR
ncbi:hypothetical protein OG792_34230 [Micromonospora sp. NBC_01699]|uniref:hypothetical protein n=1 Tax=Micromonospora sp. NBC_01699 TaxID=2975984 RepID=UPI002E2DFCA3|nr:hypothetical protein [Micromonospora sp. NBC_01699]